MRDDRGKRTIIIVVVIILALLLLAWAAGLFSVATEGDVDLPEVSIEGGNLPDVDVDAANVNLTTDRETIQVPDVDVDVGTTNQTITTPEINVEPANAAAEQ